MMISLRLSQAGWLAGFSILLLSGCSTMGGVYDQTVDTISSITGSSEAPDKPKVKEKNMLARARDLDKADDTTYERNELILDLLNEADQSCNAYLTELTKRGNEWTVPNKYTEKSMQYLHEAITIREIDRISDKDAALAKLEKPKTGQHLGDLMAKDLRAVRLQAREAIEFKLSHLDFYQYTPKQAFLDLQTYQQMCTYEFAETRISKALQPRMTEEEKAAEIERLIEMRKTLMQEGMSTRALQQRIDELILGK